MKKQTVCIFASLFLLAMASITNGMDPITKLGKQGKIAAYAILTPYIPSQPHLTKPLCYSLTPVSFDEETGTKSDIEPYVSVSRLQCCFFNTETRQKIKGLELAYYPSIFPLSLIIAEHPKIHGFLQVGPITKDGHHVLNHCATFTKSGQFVEATEYDGQAFYNQQSCFTVPVTITFQQLSALQQQVPSFLENPTINTAGLCSQEYAIQAAIDLGVLKYDDSTSKLQHSENGSLNVAKTIQIFEKEAAKIDNFRRKVQKRGTVAAILDGQYPKQYSSNKKRRLTANQSNNTTTTTTTTTTKSATE